MRTLGLAHAGASVAILGRRAARAEEVAAAIRGFGGEAVAAATDVLDPAGLDNTPAASVPESRSYFDLPPAALREVLKPNLMGTVLPCQVFGRAMARS